jgi:protein O-mannosyl-transferase
MTLPSLPRRSTLVTVCAGFFVLMFLIYGQSLRNPFVRWDDGLLIYENPAIRAITPTTVKAVFSQYDPELYIPLTFLSYQIDYQIGGTNPTIYHTTNLLLHTLNALLVTLLAFLLTGNGWLGLLTGLLFAVHPINTEAVAWSSARKDVLSAFFFLLSVISYLIYRETHRARWYWTGLSALLLGLLSKVIVAMQPATLFLLDWRAKRPWRLRTVAEKTPHLLLAVLFIIIAFIGKSGVSNDLAMWQMGLLAVRSTVFYLQKFFWPFDLGVLYPVTETISITHATFAFPTVVLCALLFGTAVSLRHTRAVAFGLGWYVLFLLPSFTTFSKGGDIYMASDRYVYLASIGIFLIISQGIVFLTTHLSTGFSRAIITGCAAVVVLLGVKAHLQAPTWNGTEALFRNVLTYTTNAHVAYANIGNAERRREEYDAAKELYEKALAIRDHPRTRANLGATLLRLGQTKEARTEFDHALALDPESKEAFFGYGLWYATEGDYEQAIASYQRAVALDPTYAEAYLNLGAMFAKLSRFDEAIEQYDEAIRIVPFYAQAHYNRGVALRHLQRNREAMEAYERAATLEPAFVGAHINLGILYVERKRVDDAIHEFRTALELNPGNEYAKAALQQLGVDQ